MATDYDGQGKGHDPLCPYGPHRAPTVAPCRTCLVINKVRADEREQAAQRVAAITSWPDTTAQYDDLDRLCRWHAAINAARNQHHPQGDTTP